MTARPTPETDRVERYGGDRTHEEWAIFARQLERERDALRERIAELEGDLAGANRESEVRGERELRALARAQSAEAKLAGARADAERYRWLRVHINDLRLGESEIRLADKALDAAIDAATEPL